MMTNDAGLIEVHGLVARDEECALGIHEAVDENAIILEQVISKLASLELQVATMHAATDVNRATSGRSRPMSSWRTHGWTSSCTLSSTT